MEKEIINNSEQEDKFTTKDKIIGLILVLIILLEIIVLVITIKKDKSINYFEVKGVAKTYALKSNLQESFPIKLECKEKQEIEILLEKGIIESEEKKLDKINENNYRITCEKDEIIYWIPNEEISEDETINIKFKSNKEKYKEQEMKIKKQEGEYRVIK